MILIEARPGFNGVRRVGMSVEEQLELFARCGFVFQAVGINKADGIMRFGREIRTVGQAQYALINTQG